MSNPTETALARQDARPTVWTAIEKLRPQMAQALPAHMPVDRMMRIALTMIRKDQLAGGHLAECTPESFSGALVTASVLGLEPGINGEAYLVPYKQGRNYECQLIIGYQGMAKLFYQHPLAQHLDAHAVYSKDEFEYWYGTSPMLRHRPGQGEDRGQITHYYATATLSSGASAFVVLTPAEVRELRNGKEGPSGKIADPMKWMERKTAIRQLLKLLPKSATLARAIEADERGGHELQTQLVVERDMPALDERPDVPPDAAVEGPDDPEPAEAATGPAEAPEPAAAQPAPRAAATPTEATAMITASQRPKLQALLLERALNSAEDRARALSLLLDRDITAMTDLTKDEAKAAIDTIEGMSLEQFAAIFAPGAE